MATHTIASGKTTPGNTAWQVYAPNAVFVDVNTSSGRFGTVPVYITSLGGNGNHWSVAGATSIYTPTLTGFRVYIKWLDGSPLTPATANGFAWHINWVGMEL